MTKTRNVVRSVWVLVITAFLAMGLVACGQQAQTSSSAQAGSSGQSQASTASQDRSEVSAQAQGSGSSQQQAAELYGSPWVTGIFIGNLPAEAPKATDDLYLHYCYDYIAKHQDAPYHDSVQSDASNELKEAVTGTIKNGAVENDELAQLRIFYEQAADFETLEANGSGELKPYLEAIANTKSLAELESLLVSPDFPFNPWIYATVNASGMKSSMCPQVMPDMLFADELTGPDAYRDSDDPIAAKAYQSARAEKTSRVQMALGLVSLASDNDQAVSKAEEYFELEKRYGKECMPSADGLDAEYGLKAQQQSLYTADELAAACPNYPVLETLAKLGKSVDHGIVVTYPGWLTAFNSVWTEENFELLRGMTEVKVLCECEPFMAPSYFANVRKKLGQADQTADERAFAACDKTNTFSQLLAKTYVEETLGEQAVDDLSKLANDLIDAYIEIIGNTPWLNAQTRENIIDKIDNMALNVLYPDGGYFDYSGLKLVPTDQGGTLLGNYLAVKAYNNAQESALIGQPARAGMAWLHQPSTLGNCFYDAASNSIAIFPGYVTSVMYTKDMSREELLGGIGFTVAHEISHAFDYEGSQFNAYGEPTAIYVDDDVSDFVERCRKLADHYSTIEITPGNNANGGFENVEATADLCGLQAVLYRTRMDGGLDQEKVFAHFASKWASVYAPVFEGALKVDPHPPLNLRINVSAQMLPEFYDTFGAAEGDAMYLAPDKRIVIWGE